MEEMEQPALPESEVQETPETQPTDDISSSTDEPTESVESDDEEIEHEGAKYKVPKPLKEAFLRQADYTTKTQTLAEERRGLEAERQQLAAQQQFQQQHIKDVAKVMSIDERLEQFRQIDWNAAMDADPVGAMKLDRQMRELQQQRTQVVQFIEQTQARTSYESQQATARRNAEAAQELAREIKGFGTPEVTKALKDTGKAFGYKPEELDSVSDPRAVRLLHEAYLYRKLVAEKKAPEAGKTITPITRVSGAAATVQKDPSRMSDSEFAQWRKRQIAQRN